MTPHIEQSKPATGMVMDVEVGEGFTVTVPTPGCPGRNVTVTLLYKAGRRARLRVSTDDDVQIAKRDAETQAG
jgi:hypothetical protein